MAIAVGLVAVTTAGTAGASAGAGAASGSGSGGSAVALSRMDRAARELARVARPDGRATGANPWLSWTDSGSNPDQADWVAKYGRDAAVRARSAAHRSAAAKARTRPPLAVSEAEAQDDRGSNDTTRTAQPLPGLGTAGGRNPAATVRGNQSPATVDPARIVDVAPGPVDDSTEDKATDLGELSADRGVRTTGSLPDGPGSELGLDFDVYRLVLPANHRFRIDITRLSGDLLVGSYLFREGASASVDFGPSVSQNPERETAEVAIRDAGVYYLYLFNGNVLSFTGETPPTPGDFTRGDYQLQVSAAPDDRDVYAVRMRAGDVLGATARGARRVAVLDRAGEELVGSFFDLTPSYPVNSPLPGTGGAGPTADFVAPKAGTYYVEISNGNGAYASGVQLFRHGGNAGRVRQTVFLDFDGAQINNTRWGGTGTATLSPLRAFLGKWGLRAKDERALIRAVQANVQENIEHDLRESGLSDSVSVKVVTNLDGPDLWGKPGVTRIVVGGTVAESGLPFPTVGIANSIDPGNFDKQETGLVLMDYLSSPVSDGFQSSINAYLKPGSDRLGFVAQAIGNVTSHEIGHMIGSWHTDEGNDVNNLMDAGGNAPNTFGVGADGIGGTRDDTDVDFGADTFSLAEGLSGMEDTLARSTWAMSTR
ncbi:MAG: hypothetical protein ACRC35_05975 [Angustibacter sp.]